MTAQDTTFHATASGPNENNRYSNVTSSVSPGLIEVNQYEHSLNQSQVYHSLALSGQFEERSCDVDNIELLNILHFHSVRIVAIKKLNNDIFIKLIWIDI